MIFYNIDNEGKDRRINMNHERVIVIRDFLARRTDSEKGVTIKDIQNHLAECGLENVSILTIRRDIERIANTGDNIQTIHGRHNTAYYKIIDKGFSFNEIRFIVDSISINKFMSNYQKKLLIRKFEGMCSESEVRQLISRISLNGRETASMNLLENLEKVHRIISQKCKINFDYGKYDVTQQINYYSKKREMIPCKVIYFDDRFYLKCIDEETGKIRTYRIDRMKHITEGDKTKIKAVLPSYEGVVLDMFEPEYFEIVTLKIKRFLLDDMLEHFGRHISVRSDESSVCVMVNIKVGISSGFYRWIMKYGEDIEIVSPENIREQFSEKLEKVSQIYKR